MNGWSFDLGQGARLGQGGYIPQLSLDQSPLLSQSVPSSIPLDQAGGGPGIFGSLMPTYGANGQMTGQGWGGLALGAITSGLNAYMGMKQYGLAKDQFAESKKQFGMNFDAQRRTTNAALADRQAARISSSPSSFASVADYMAKYGIPGG